MYSKAQVRMLAGIGGYKAETLGHLPTADVSEGTAVLEAVREELREVKVLVKHGVDVGTCPSQTYFKVTGKNIPLDKVDAALAMFKG